MAKLYHRRRPYSRKPNLKSRTTGCCLPFVVFFHLYYSYISYHHKFFSIPPRTTKVNHGVSFSNSTLHTRHTTPWLKYPALRNADPPDLRPWQSNNRFLVASAADEVGDGIGHRYLVVNYELILARSLSLTYVHRTASYGSLTVSDPGAVDDFFGWPHPSHETRRDFLSSVCDATESRSVTSGCFERLVYCRRLRKSSIVKRIVTIPEHVATCLKEHSARECQLVFEKFLARHPHPGTLFHTPPLCSWKLFWSNQRHTHGFLYNRYWSAPRTSRHDPRYVNIAVHVRRGDFLNLANRVTIRDAIYARVVRQIIAIVSDEAQNDDQSVVKFRVEVYSQGLFRPQTSHPVIAYLVKKGILGFHNVNDYGERYVTEEGKEAPDSYWNELLENLPNVEVELHVSENTLEGLEQMISADILVGSMSALSIHVAGTLSRGIPFLPLRPPIGAGSNKTVIWNPFGFYIGNHNDVLESHFDNDRFREIWRDYKRQIGAD